MENTNQEYRNKFKYPLSQQYKQSGYIQREILYCN